MIERWIVAGPPCSGKTTWAEARTPGMVLDYDAVFAEVAGLPLHEQPEDMRADVDRAFRNRLEGWSDGSIIRSAPRKQHRAVLARIHQAQVMVLAVPPAECLARLAQTDRTPTARAHAADGIARWWAEYQPSSRDAMVLRG